MLKTVSNLGAGSGGTFPPAGALSNVLVSNVTLNNTSAYFDGPTIAQGNVGTWFVIATVTLEDSTATFRADAKLWDGTTIIDSGCAPVIGTGGGYIGTITLAGVIVSPAGNLKISVKDSVTVTGLIDANKSGNAKDSSITAYRIG